LFIGAIEVFIDARKIGKAALGKIGQVGRLDRRTRGSSPAPHRRNGSMSADRRSNYRPASYRFRACGYSPWRHTCAERGIHARIGAGQRLGMALEEGAVIVGNFDMAGPLQLSAATLGRTQIPHELRIDESTRSCDARHRPRCWGWTHCPLRQRAPWDGAGSPQPWAEGGGGGGGGGGGAEQAPKTAKPKPINANRIRFTCHHFTRRSLITAQSLIQIPQAGCKNARRRRMAPRAR
jgi:hypothetical protein